MRTDKTHARSDVTEGIDPTVPTMEPPVLIPKFKFSYKLGSGAMAIVYKGFDTGFRDPRPVAIKLMDEAVSRNEFFRVRFEQEAGIVAGFDHDHIVRVYTCGEVEGTKYIVMEYLEGGTLADRLERGPLPMYEGLTTMAKLADALAYSHEQKVIHRDFKPSNILFTKEGKPKLADFGVAKLVVVPTKEGTRSGTPEYWAPEQEKGGVITDRADVFSLGKTLSEVLKGKSLPLEVSELIESCMKMEPSLRPSAAECQRLLESAAENAKSLPEPGQLRRKRLVAAAAVVLFIAGLLALRAPVGVPISRSPSTATIFIDGKELTSKTARLRPGTHSIAAIAMRHYGTLESVAISAVTRKEIEFKLEPTRLPTSVEMDRFWELLEAPDIEADDFAKVTEPTLNTALRSRLLWKQKRFSELDALTQRLDTLSKLGDERSAVASVLAQSARDQELSLKLLPKMEAAAKGGDAMASYFVAVIYRYALPRPVDPSSPQYIEYCQWLARAARQGWGDVATPEFTKNNCRA